jgi:hypothetical protein
MRLLRQSRQAFCPARVISGASYPAENEGPAKLIIPAGTPITVRLQQRVASASAIAGERFEAVIDRPVVVGHQVVVPV